MSLGDEEGASDETDDLAMDRAEAIIAAAAPGEFCHRHWSWLCQSGQGRCQDEADEFITEQIKDPTVEERS